MADRQAGGRWVEVPPERLVRWVENFTLRHGPAVAEPGPEVVVLRARDGAAAACHPPFPPLPPWPQPREGQRRGSGPAGGTDGRARGGRAGPWACCSSASAVTRWACSPAIRRNWPPPRPGRGWSTAGPRPGGWSQHRFARRRENQATAALRAAADTALAVLGPYEGRLDAVVLGGDRRAMAGMRADPRLAPFIALAVERFLTVPDPRLTVLKDTPRLFRAIRIQLTEPDPP